MTNKETMFNTKPTLPKGGKKVTAKDLILKGTQLQYLPKKLTIEMKNAFLTNACESYGLIGKNIYLKFAFKITTEERMWLKRYFKNFSNVFVHE